MRIHNVEMIESSDVVVRSFEKKGGFEDESFAAWESAGKGIYIDVGAYTGLYAINAAMRGNFVYAFEPNPTTHKRMGENAGRNMFSGQMVRVCAAVSHEEGERNFGFPSGKGEWTSVGRLMEEGSPVQVVTLDSCIVPHGERVVAIKIDVEREEMGVLLGAVETLRKHKPMLIIEALDAELEEQVTEFLSEFGYGSPRRADSRNLIFYTPH